jgi:hypothetical protein
MSNGGRVPETRLLGEGELSADHAWRALRRYGMAAVPLLIALNGLASKLGDPHRGGRVVADTVLALTPGASESLVSQLLTDRGAPATWARWR